jgi:Rrf2 family protein
MRINTRACYAIRLMADVAKNSRDGRPVSLRDVAERQRLPKLYLSQLSIPLRNASLLKSVWGNKGGFLLARPAAEITLLDIVETVDGPVGVMDCVLDPNFCDKVRTCDCFGTFCAINREIVGTLKRVRLSDLAAPEGTAAAADLEMAQACDARRLDGTGGVDRCGH